jgi:hypothetical protein
VRRGSHADPGRAPGGKGPPRGWCAASSWASSTSRSVARWYGVTQNGTLPLPFHAASSSSFCSGTASGALSTHV